MAEDSQPSIRLKSQNRQKRIEKLGLSDLAFSKLFDRLLTIAEEYKEIRETLETEITREERQTEKKKRRYGLKKDNPLN